MCYQNQHMVKWQIEVRYQCLKKCICKTITFVCNICKVQRQKQQNKLLAKFSLLGLDKPDQDFRKTADELDMLNT